MGNSVPIQNKNQKNENKDNKDNNTSLPLLSSTSTSTNSLPNNNNNNNNSKKELKEEEELEELEKELEKDEKEGKNDINNNEVYSSSNKSSLNKVSFKKGFSSKFKNNENQSNNNSNNSNNSNNNDNYNNDDNDSDAIDILFELLPYHGQGDNTNDSIVRSALSAASVEDIDRRDQYGNTLLLSACQYRLEAVVRIILNKGADPNAINSAGASCLHFACYKETISKNIAKLLLQNGANPELQEFTYGCTPLHYAASSGDLDLCKVLISFGAEVKTLDYYEYTCIDYAREGNHHELANYLQTKLLMSSSHQNLFSSTTSNTLENSSNILTSPSKQPQITLKPPHQIISSIESNNTNNTTTNKTITTSTKPGQIQHSSSIITPTSRDDILSLNSPFIRKQLSSPIDTSSPLPFSQIIDNSNNNLPQPSPRNNSNNNKYPPPSPIPIKMNSSENWVSHIDISTGEKYRMNIITGECLWEADYQLRCEEEAEAAAVLKLQESKTQLQSEQFNKNLKGIALGDMFNESQGVSDDINPKLTTKTSFKSSSQLFSTTSISTPHKDSSKLEQALHEEILLLKNKIQEIQVVSDQIIEKNQSEFRQQLLEKDMKYFQLETNYQTLQRENERMENEIKELINKFQTISLTGDEATKSFQSTIFTLEEQKNVIYKELIETKSTLEITENKLKSLQDILQNLESSHTERIQNEKKAAELRALQQQERENQHNQAILEIEKKLIETKNQLMMEIKSANDEVSRVKKEAENKHQVYRQQRDEELNKYIREMTEKMNHLSQELSLTKRTLEETQKMALVADERANAAEAAQRSVMREIEEAREIIKYNTQLHRDLIREQKLRKHLHNEMEDMKGRIRVYVRIKPITQNEIAMNAKEAVLKDGKMSVLVLGHQDAESRKNFDFDQVFGGSNSNGNSQLDIFRDTKHLMLSVIDGYNVCIFAYGQTGSGKTYTMIGGSELTSSILPNGECHELAGITPRAVAELFRLVNERHAQCTAEINVQMFQLYRDNLEDLLQGIPNKKKKVLTNDQIKRNATSSKQLKVTLAEHSPTGLVQVEGAETLIGESVDDVLSIIQYGLTHRTIASTNMNSESSRSHLICVLLVTLTNRNNGLTTVGKLTLVDLAGSERISKSGVTGEVLKETQSINKSLSAISNVITSLTSGNTHIPYRNHILTMLMSDTIGGNSKTLIYINCSSINSNVSESHNSLVFGSQCKTIKNNTSNNNNNNNELNLLKKELNKLKKDKGIVVNQNTALSRPT